VIASMIKYVENATTGRPKKMSYRSGRNKKLCIRVSDDDLKRLEYVAHFYNKSKSDIILLEIERSYYEAKKLENEMKERGEWFE
jgi:hypothetical protein